MQHTSIMSKKAISFSLWGHKPEYLRGAIRNAELTPKIYPGWKSFFYVNSQVDSKFIEELKCVNTSFNEVFVMESNDNNTSNFSCLFWRFLPLIDREVKLFVSRDCDSRLSDKEYQAVLDWENSDKQFHCMRDSVYHSYPPMMGGMCGFKNDGIVNPVWTWNELIKNNGKNYNDDQLALINFYNRFSNLFLEHDDMLRHNSKKFPQHSPFEIGTFIGQKINEDDKSYDELGISVFWQNNEPLYIKKI